MERELEEIHRSLKEGAELTKKLQRRHGECSPLLKAVRQSRILKNLPPEKEVEVNQFAREALANELVRSAVEYSDRHRFGITNWSPSKRDSEYEPPEKPWRPFLANLGYVSGKESIAAQLQHLLFGRVFERLKGVYVFPAVGLDGRFLSGRVVTIGPHEAIQAPRASTAHIAKKAEELGPEDVQKAERSLGAKIGEPRVLVLKGVESLLEKDELKRLFRNVGPSYIVAFGTAASGFKDTPKGVPRLDEKLHQLVTSSGYKEATDEFFSGSELRKVGEIHNLLRDYFAWQSGHFPASQVRVYRREE